MSVVTNARDKIQRVLHEIYIEKATPKEAIISTIYTIHR
jgi:hypothetical protein